MTSDQDLGLLKILSLEATDSKEEAVQRVECSCLVLWEVLPAI